MSTTYFTAGEVSAELHARLSKILIAQGAETDIGRDVMMGRRKIPGDDQPPCIQVLEGLDNVMDQPGRIPSCLIAQEYQIDAFIPCDPDNPNMEAHAAIRDIKRAIFEGGSNWGGKVRKVNYLGRDIGPRPDGAALVQARVMISVEYVEDLTNP